MRILTRGALPTVAMLVALVAIAGCSQSTSSLGNRFTAVKSMILPSYGNSYRATARERECLARAMFFESNRSSRDGLIAVGSVVMNRRDSGKWGDSICEVVGAKRQFAPGVLTRPMNSKSLPDVMEAADAVLKGERHPKVHKDVMFFHTAGLKFPYKNMHYTTVAGGNAFYEKRSRKRDRLPIPQIEQPSVMVAENVPDKPEPSQEGWLGRGKAKPVDEVQVAFADDVPIAAEALPAAYSSKRKAVEPEVGQVEFADDVPLPSEPPAPTPRAGSRKKAASATPEPALASVEAPATEVYEAPSDERFGGDIVQPAYAGEGNGGFGNGTGILGQLVIEAE